MAAMALSPWWLFHTALGNSEGLLGAAVLWAVIAHLSGHTRAALACATAAALMRPEAWPFLGLYGVWLWRAMSRRAVVAAAAIVPLLWFGPDLLGAGGALGASHTARGVPSPGSAKLESSRSWPSSATRRRSARSPPWSARCSPPSSAGRSPVASSSRPPPGSCSWR